MDGVCTAERCGGYFGQAEGLDLALSADLSVCVDGVSSIKSRKNGIQ